jgi:hypothetical protein
VLRQIVIQINLFGLSPCSYAFEIAVTVFASVDFLTGPASALIAYQCRAADSFGSKLSVLAVLQSD